MPALAIADFSAVFHKDRSRFEVDLSRSNLIEVLEAYADYKRHTSPNFENSSIIYNIREIQNRYLQVLMPEDITDIFYSAFRQWAGQRGMRKSSIGTYLGGIASALRWGTKHGVRVSSTFDEYKTHDTEEPHRVSLTADDISHIAYFDVNTIKCRADHKRTLEKVRDTFVIQTNLFCRFSDCERISRDNFDGHKFRIVQQKTGQKAVVDIDAYSVTPKLVMQLLEKYDYTIPYKGGINNYNKYLHELMSYIGGSFDEMVSFEERVNGEVVKATYKKRDLITSHTSRRSAITLAVQSSKTETEVRRCSGHTSAGRDSFRKYVVYSD